MWEIDSLKQIITFALSLTFGGVLCIFYDTVYAVRCVCKFSWLQTFITDILFWLITSVSFFCFLLATVNGEVRGYLILGLFLGFFAVYFLFSKYIRKTFTFVFGKIRNIFVVFNLFLRKLVLNFSLILIKFFGKISQFLKKALKRIKKLLKKGITMLYTKRVDCEKNNEQVDYEKEEKE